MFTDRFLHLSVASCLFLAPSIAFAQDTCTDEQKAALALCLEQCDTTCNAASPGCVRQPITLEEVRAAIAAQCNCDTARNYGQYRSCVAKLLGALKQFSLIDDATKTAIGEDNKTCRDAIKARRHAENPEKGPKEDEGS